MANGYPDWQRILVRPTYLDGGWETEGFKINPGVGVLLADTGELDAGYYDFVVLINSAAQLWRPFKIEHRDAANATTLGFQEAGTNPGPVVVAMLPHFKMVQGERLRVIMQLAVLTVVQSSIVWAHRSTLSL